MTRDEAVVEVLRLAGGLAPDPAGARRLLERVAVQPDPAPLSAVLVELGALAVLDEGDDEGD